MIDNSPGDSLSLASSDPLSLPSGVSACSAIKTPGSQSFGGSLTWSRDHGSRGPSFFRIYHVSVGRYTRSETLIGLVSWLEEHGQGFSAWFTHLDDSAPSIERQSYGLSDLIADRLLKALFFCSPLLPPAIRIAILSDGVITCILLYLIWRDESSSERPRDPLGLIRLEACRYLDFLEDSLSLVIFKNQSAV